MTRHKPMTVGMRWAERGFPAFPIAIGWDDTKHGTTKRPLTPHGHQDATTDPEIVRDLFVQYADRLRDGEELAAGMRPDGFVVVDADRHGHGDGPAYATSIGLNGTWTVDTASGGEHRLYRKPDGATFTNSVPEAWRGLIDVRADGGWIVCPGTGTSWGTWVPRTPWNPDEVTDLPDHVATMLTPATNTTGGWRTYTPDRDNALLHPFTVELHDLLVDQYGIDPDLTVVRQVADGDEVRHVLDVCRPGKTGGTSGTVGFVGPDVLYVFTDNWPGLPGNRSYSLQRLAGADPVILNTDPGTVEAEAHGIALDDLDPQVRDLVLDLLRRDRAKEIVAELRAAQAAARPVDAGILTDILNRDPEPPARIDGLLPSDGRLLLTATRKTGKTTWLLNLARSLITGEPFLGTLPVRPIDGTVALLNYEVSGATLARWAAEAGVPTDRLLLVNLRGRRNLLATTEGRTELVDLLTAHSVDVLLVDPFGRAYTGKSQNDAGEVEPWLVRLDEVTTDAGCTELVLAAHAGWSGEHARGSSALEGWPDSNVWLTRDPDTDERFMRAEGRDIALDEDRLGFAQATRMLTLTGGGSRRESADARRLDEIVAALVDVVTRKPGLGVRAIAREWRDVGFVFTNGEEQNASRAAVERGLVAVEPGRNNTKTHHLKQVTPGASEVPPRDTRDTK